jgi:hypothetical protein
MLYPLDSGSSACADPPRKQHWTKNKTHSLRATLYSHVKIKFFCHFGATLSMKKVLEKRTWSVVYTLTPSLAKCAADPKSA